MPNPKDPVKMEEYRRKQSAASKGRVNTMKGKKCNPKAVEKRRQSLLKTCSTPEYREKMSRIAKSIGTGKWMRGRACFGGKRCLGHPQTEESRQKIAASKAGIATSPGPRSEQARKNISASKVGRKNPMYGKPAHPRAGRGCCGTYKGWLFRSGMELAYMVRVIEANGWDWLSAESESIRIGYSDDLGRERTYTPDFLVCGTRLVEVKPRCHQSLPLVLRKKAAAEIYCAERGWTYEMAHVRQLPPRLVRELLASGNLTFYRKPKDPIRTSTRKKD